MQGPVSQRRWLSSVVGVIAATAMVVGALALVPPHVSAAPPISPATSSSEVYWDDAQLAKSPIGTGSSVAVTADDTVLVTGYFTGTTYFPTGPNADDSIALTSSGIYDVFVAAVNADDSYFAWAQRAGGTGNDRGQSVAVAADGTVLVTGYLNGTASFPTGPSSSITLTVGGGNGAFVAAVNADDSYFAWAQGVGGSGIDVANSVAVTADDTVLVTGYFSGTASFPTGPSSAITLTASGSLDVFVATLSSDDSYFAWAQRAGDAGSAVATSVAVTADDTVLVTGYFSGTASFPTGPSSAITLTASGSADDVFVAAVNADDSYFAWAQRAGGTGADRGQSVAVTTDDTVLVTGYFNGTASFPTGPSSAITLTGSGGMDAFVAAVNADDTYFAWAQMAGGTGADRGQSVAVTADDTVLVTGQIGGTASFPTGPTTSISLVSPGTSPFVGWMNASFAPAPAPPTPTPVPPAPIPPSAPLEVAAVAGDASATITWQAPASPGSYPVTDYEVTSSPGGRICLVSATTCRITGLVNGTSYTFTVRALSGAGWGAASAPSAPVTPVAAPRASMVITGSRDAGAARFVRVSGLTTGLVGELVTSWVRFAGQGSYSAGSVPRVVAADGTFDWQRRTGKEIYVYFTHERVKSNVVSIPARKGR